MTRRSMATTFIALVAILMIVQMQLDIQQVYSTSFDKDRSTRDRRIGVVLDFAQAIHKSGDPDLLSEMMRTAVEDRLVDFVFISAHGEVVKTWLTDLIPQHDFEDLSREFPTGQLLVKRPSQELMETGSEEVRFIERKLDDDWRIKVGHFSNRQKFIDRHAKLYQTENQRTTLFAILLALGVFFYAARDILRLTRQLGQRGLAGIKDQPSSSVEAEKIRQGLLGLKGQSERLKAKTTQYERQILPALRSELSSGLNPPYSFDCTMVRTDINQFTKYFNSPSNELFVETIRRFFDECALIIGRNQGLIYEFVGDEVIYYFKDQSMPDSATRAIHCVHEINTLAAEIDRQHRDTFRFTVKSSLSKGKLRFGPLLNGFALSGGPLIETTRILSHVSERDGSRLYFDQKVAKQLSNRITTYSAFSVQLKGFDRQSEIVQVDFVKSGLDLGLTLAQLIQEDLLNFRDPRSVKFAIEVLKRPQARNLSILSLLQSVQFLNEANLETLTFAWFQLTEQLYGELVDRVRPNPKRLTQDLDWHTLCVMTQVYPQLVPPAYRSTEHRDLLLKVFAIDVPRLRANTILAMGTAFSGDSKVIELIDQQRRSDQDNFHRAKSVALIAAAERDGLNSEVIQQLRSMIGSDRPLEVSAGLYSLGEIVRLYLDHDPAHLRTQLEVMDLVRGLNKWAGARDEMIQRQAKLALQKSRVLHDADRSVA